MYENIFLSLVLYVRVYTNKGNAFRLNYREHDWFMICFCW